MWPASSVFPRMNLPSFAERTLKLSGRPANPVQTARFRILSHPVCTSGRFEPDEFADILMQTHRCQLCKLRAILDFKLSIPHDVCGHIGRKLVAARRAARTARFRILSRLVARLFCMPQDEPDDHEFDVFRRGKLAAARRAAGRPRFRILSNAIPQDEPDEFARPRSRYCVLGNSDVPHGARTHKPDESRRWIVRLELRILLRSSVGKNRAPGKRVLDIACIK